jgi:hypothetical protein
LVTSDSSGAEQTIPSGWVNPASNGIALNTTNVTWNGSGYTYVGWQWKANGSGSTNTSGSITSTVSANTTSGFSVVTYTGNGTAGASVGHGLGVTPAFIIIKDRNATAGWIVYSQAFATPSSNYLVLNTTAAVGTGAGFCTPSSTTLTYPTVYAATNTNGTTYVAYCFAEISGYSKFGSYTGNASTDGPFVFTGFRPAFVLIRSTGVQGWYLYDSARGTYNVIGPLLEAQSSAAESTATQLDFLSNGFKIRESGTGSNSSGVAYIYIAFASNPFKYSLAR